MSPPVIPIEPGPIAGTRLVVVGPAPSKKTIQGRNTMRSLCLCACGREFETNNTSIRTKNKNSITQCQYCSSKINASLAAAIRWTDVNHDPATTTWIILFHYLQRMSINRANKAIKNHKDPSKYKVELTLEQYKDIAQQKCFWAFPGCEGPRLHSSYVRKDGSKQKSAITNNMTDDTIAKSYVSVIGIDRINNDLGYIVGNCVPCCTSCNTKKRSDSIPMMIEAATQLLSRQEELIALHNSTLEIEV